MDSSTIQQVLVFLILVLILGVSVVIALVAGAAGLDGLAAVLGAGCYCVKSMQRGAPDSKMPTVIEGHVLEELPAPTKVLGESQ